jgi:hypothetical protein
MISMSSRPATPTNATNLPTATDSHLPPANARAQSGTKGRKRLSEILSLIPAKIIGRAARVSPDVARRWKDGTRNPSSESLLELASVFPEVRAYVLARIDPGALVSMGSGDPDFMSGQMAFGVNEYLRNQRNGGK